MPSISIQTNVDEIRNVELNSVCYPTLPGGEEADEGGHREEEDGGSREDEEPEYVQRGRRRDVQSRQSQSSHTQGKYHQ